ncbi:phage major capsid protein [Agrobacterium sp. MAFF310724]|uniref:phage major capsid protein n=1 Tax=Agrobacterium TaxID=357 RepID=UPI001386C23D|nr:MULTISPECIES: phage major capsid protein [Agrobacterium]MDA5240644.1 phage major capsid protein [Agrobacterium sp. MAFF310724]MDA5249817.1 phage major capsid protein [Agrobacterium sp. MAFF210268]
MNLFHLRETRASKLAEIKALGDNPDTAKFTALESEIRSLDGQIKNAATIAEFERHEAAPQGDNKTETRSYNLAKAIREQAEGRLTGIEKELHDELSKNAKETRGVRVPASLFFGGEKREMTVANAAAAGNTVPTVMGSLIDRLKPASKVQGMGATVLSGLVGNVELPRHLTGPTAYWLAESGKPTESNSTFDKVALTPRTVAAEQKLSRRLILQNGVALEDVLKQDLNYVLSNALDTAILTGTGANNQPTGILTAIPENDTTSTEISDIAADLIGDIVLENNGTGAFLVSSALMNRIRKIKDADGHPISVSEIFHGQPVVETNQIATPTMVYGIWSDALIGTWSSVDLLVDPYTYGSEGALKLVAFLDADVQTRHGAKSFQWKTVA